jgi:integrase
MYINGGENMTPNKFTFTKASLDTVASPDSGKRNRVRDLKVRGLLLDVTSSGTKTFYVRKKVKGVSSWHRIGEYPELSIEQARGLAGQINADIAQGRNPHEKQRAENNELTLGQMFQFYIQRHAKKSAKTYQALEQNFERYLKELKARKLSSISNQEMEEIHQKLGDERGTYVANRTIQLLRAVFNKAILWKLFEGSNPAAGITLFREKARERFLSTEEVQRLFSVLEAEPDTDLRDFVWLSLLTGVRKNNILSMRWDDIDFAAKTWLIAETKNGIGQLVPLSEREIAVLDHRRQQIKGEFVFPSKSQSGHVEDPRRSWTSLLRRARIEDCTLHDLRRNLGSWMASENVNVALIKSALNHKDMKTTMAVYTRTAKRAELQARAIAHRAMFEAAGLGTKEAQTSC